MLFPADFLLPHSWVFSKVRKNSISHHSISRRDTEPLPMERMNTSKKNNNIKKHPANPMTCRVNVLFAILANYKRYYKKALKTSIISAGVVFSANCFSRAVLSIVQSAFRRFSINALMASKVFQSLRTLDIISWLTAFL